MAKGAAPALVTAPKFRYAATMDVANSIRPETGAGNSDGKCRNEGPSKYFAQQDSKG